jgi:ubiquinone/menaquinone biosynthesis C-methylase UbiE
MSTNPNIAVWAENYDPADLDRPPETEWDRYLHDLKTRLIRENGRGRDVLDLGCGSGAFLVPHLSLFRSAIAVDFSATMLAALRAKLPTPGDANLQILEDDAETLSLPNESLDFVWSYAALYYVPHLEAALAHVARVLRPGGRAALELGNSHSLNELVSQVQHRRLGWARPQYRPYHELRRAVAGSGLIPIEWRSFQLLTMYGTPRILLPLAPLLSSRWKHVMGRQLRGKSIDEWVSGAPGFRAVAFRHLVLAEKA